MKNTGMTGGEASHEELDLPGNLQDSKFCSRKVQNSSWNQWERGLDHFTAVQLECQLKLLFIL